MPGDDSVLERLGKVRLRYPLAATVGLAAVMWLLAPDYAAAQASTTARELRDIVAPHEADAYRWAAIVDMPFAIAYALLSWTIAGTVAPEQTRLRRIARGGAALVAVAALIDLVENVGMVRNLSAYETVADSAVRTVSRFGPPKWGLGLLGATTALVAALVARRARAADNPT